MNKPLSELSNEELWQLFPIIISEHNPYWKDAYRTEKCELENIFGIDNIVRINHIGSTAVPDLLAKPTIDILVEIRGATDVDKLIIDMECAGYICSPQPNNPPPHLMFMKGYTLRGFEGQAYHIHVRYQGDWDELYFRDYLLLHPKVAKRYGKLKLQLQKKFEHERDAYTNAKTDFIVCITKLARKEFPHQYNPTT